MKRVRSRGLPRLIELAGLPGAGKTSITTAVSISHLGSTGISIAHFPFRRETWRIIRAACALSLTIRPLRSSLLLRVINLVLALRCYGETAAQIVILDQGLVQKTWSLLAGSRSHSTERLEGLVAALSPFMADHLVWVGVSRETAAQRIANRVCGNSRFDGLSAPEIAQKLENAEALYDQIIALFLAQSEFGITKLDGEADLAKNAEILAVIAAGEPQTGIPAPHQLPSGGTSST